MATFKNRNKDEERNSQSEKSLSRNNYPKNGDNKSGNKTFTMEVVANAGDPGIFEDEHYDILSRFVICQMNSANRVPTNQQAHKMYYLVKRPEHLWITGENVDSKANNFVSSRRKDYMGNVNVGKADNPSIKTIPNMSTEYKVGERLNCKKLPYSLNIATSSVFTSAFDNTEFANIYANGPQEIIGTPDASTKYTDEYWQRSSFPSNTQVADGHMFDPNGNHIASVGAKDQAAGGSGMSKAVQLKPLYPSMKQYRGPITITQQVNRGIADKYYATGVTANNYHFILHYYIVHSALGLCNQDNATTVDRLKNQAQRYQTMGLDLNNRVIPPLINFKGGFLGHNIILGSVVYEDLNSGAEDSEKQRTITDSCMPLIVASPNQFPTPKTRAAGAIVYQPTYAVVAGQAGGGGGAP